MNIDIDWLHSSWFLKEDFLRKSLKTILDCRYYARLLSKGVQFAWQENTKMTEILKKKMIQVRELAEESVAEILTELQNRNFFNISIKAVSKLLPNE